MRQPSITRCQGLMSANGSTTAGSGSPSTMHDALDRHATLQGIHWLQSISAGHTAQDHMMSVAQRSPRVHMGRVAWCLLLACGVATVTPAKASGRRELLGIPKGSGEQQGCRGLTLEVVLQKGCSLAKSEYLSRTRPSAQRVQQSSIWCTRLLSGPYACAVTYATQQAEPST